MLAPILNERTKCLLVEQPLIEVVRATRKTERCEQHKWRRRENGYENTNNTQTEAVPSGNIIKRAKQAAHTVFCLKAVSFVRDNAERYSFYQKRSAWCQVAPFLCTTDQDLSVSQGCGSVILPKQSPCLNEFSEGV